MSQRPPIQYWWVNHKYAAAQGLAGEYLRSQERNRNGSRNESQRNLTRVQPGDLVFAFADGAVRAVGIALRSSTKASPEKGEWQLPVRFLQLGVPLNPKMHMLKLKPVLPRSYSPLRTTGARNPAVYLAAVSDAMAVVLRQLLDQQLEDIEAQINAAVGSELADDWIEATIQRRTNELFKALDMEEFRDRRCAKLSTGMKQKVSIARTLIHDPPVMVFDEPTNGLDVMAARSITDFIRQCRERGKTVIFSTHVMTEAEKLCDRIGIIHGGHMRAEGTLEQLRQNYRKQSL